MGSEMKLTGDGHCAQLLERFSQYLDGELDESCCQTLRAHLQQCPECVETMDGLERILKLCRSALNNRDVPSPSPAFRAALREKILGDDPSAP
jgi:anti-sigma factor (TIGR02949 family)